MRSFSTPLDTPRRMPMVVIDVDSNLEQYSFGNDSKREAGRSDSKCNITGLSSDGVSRTQLLYALRADVPGPVISRSREQSIE
jgi:hypothetical protein